MLGQGGMDWVTVLRRRSFRFRLHASLATWREGEGRFPLARNADLPLPASRDGIRVRAPQGRWGWAIGRVSPGVRTAS